MLINSLDNFLMLFPKSTATRKAEIVDGSDPDQLRKVVSKMKEALEAMVIK